ncbi:MAG: hypothetical protein F7C35_03625 [Desulfurococcales archaeon]|nr:hypothetical protein [Desulfurococcales archaeon]
MRNKLVKIIAALTAILLTSYMLSASIFTYDTTHLTIIESTPPLWFELPTSTADVALGPNSTSATINITLSGTAELLQNPDFYYDADPWRYAANNASLYAYWLSSDTGSSGGVVVIYGDITSSGTYYAVLLQNFTVPFPTNTLNMSIRYMVESVPILSLNYLIYGIDEWNGTAWVNIYNSYTSLGRTSAYTDYNVTLNLPATLQPGVTYRFWFGVYSYVYFYITRSLDFRADWAMLLLTSGYYAFAGEAVRINDTKTVYARLYVYNFTSNASKLNATIYLDNETSRTTSITVINGNLTQSSTSWIRLDPPPNPLYVSGKIIVLANDTVTGESIVLRGFLQYSSGGYAVYYPVTITIRS